MAHQNQRKALGVTGQRGELERSPQGQEGMGHRTEELVF